MRERRRGRLDGEGRERGGAIAWRQCFHNGGAPVKLVAVERFRRPAREIRVVQQRRDDRRVRVARGADRAVGVVGDPEVARHPIVDQGVGGTSVEGENVILACADVSDIADTAPVQHHQRFWQRRRERTVIQRRQWRALPARRDVGVAEAVDDGKAQPSRGARAVAELPCCPRARIVEDRLAMKADKIDARPVDAVCLHELFDRRAVFVRDAHLHIRKRVAARPRRVGDH